jgi:hypothetical protein
MRSGTTQQRRIVLTNPQVSGRRKRAGVYQSLQFSLHHEQSCQIKNQGTQGK